MQNGRIRSTQLSASSFHGTGLAPRNGRLHFRRSGSRLGAWCALYNTRYQWYQVDFGRCMRVIKIATMGRQDYPQWVKQYFIEYSVDGGNFAEYKENSNRKVRIGKWSQIPNFSLPHIFRYFFNLQFFCRIRNFLVHTLVVWTGRKANLQKKFAH